MINEDIWIHIVEMRRKAYYLVAKLESEDAKKLAEAAEAIYETYKEEFL